MRSDRPRAKAGPTTPSDQPMARPSAMRSGPAEWSRASRMARG
jgi:hypothetical protein